MTHESAIQWTGDNISEIFAWLEQYNTEPIYFNGFTNRDEVVGVPTVSGIQAASINDWIEKADDGFRVWTQAEWEATRFPAILREWKEADQ